MHTSLNDPHIFVVFEIVAVSKTTTGEIQEVGGGWGFYKIFQSATQAVDTSSKSPAPAKA